MREAMTVVAGRSLCGERLIDIVLPADEVQVAGYSLEMRARAKV